MNTQLLYTALSMGLLGSLHCAGMCGPIMLILPFQLLNGWKKALAIALYHTGRISVYALMGLLLHSFKALFNPQWQQYISATLGLLLLLAGFLSFFASGRGKIRLPWLDFVKQQSARIIGRTNLGSLFLAGVLNGLLPCGLVYMALSLSATAATPVDAILSMYLFGLGTLPMLLAIIILKSKVKLFQLQTVRKFVPALMILFGGLFLLRGMNLGIPYLSPSVVLENNEVKSSCCHH